MVGRAKHSQALDDQKKSPQIHYAEGYSGSALDLLFDLSGELQVS